MIEVLKMKYRGCCGNCLSAVGEKDIYKLVVGCLGIEICEDCFPGFVEEINKKYVELFERKE